MFVDLVETISLCAEIFYRVDGLLELLGALCDPIAGELSAFAVDAGNEVLDLADVPLGGGEKHLLDVAGVDLEETDVGLLGEILTEVITVEPEQLDGEVEHVNRRPETLIDQNIKVELLVAPVDLEEVLEAGNESLRLLESTFDNSLDAEVFRPINLLLCDPALGIEEDLIRHVPLSLLLVPLLKRICIIVKVLMLAPASE